MRRHAWIQTFGFVLLAIILMTLTGIWHASWKHVAEREEERILQVRFSTMVDGAASFRKMALRAGDRSVRRSAPARVTTAYRAVNSRGDVVGYIIPFKGRGYQDDIEGMVAVNVSARKILRLVLTGSRESPETDLFARSGEFIDQFQGVDCRSPVRLMLPADKGIHAITGASVSSRIVVRLVNEHIQILKSHLQETEGQGEGTR